jgi:hypothetical protein
MCVSSDHVDQFLRPNAVVLPESATIPEANLVLPAPDAFSHRVARAQPYFYAVPRRARAPDGTFDAGTQVLVLKSTRGRWCHVADARGLRVVTARDGLEELPESIGAG